MGENNSSQPSKEERIQQLKNEIADYHKKAEIQNRDIVQSAQIKNLYHSAFTKGMLLWCLLIFIAILWVVKNFEILSQIELGELLPYAFMIALGGFLLTNAISLFVVSLTDKNNGYYKVKIGRLSFIFLLISIVLFVVSITNISGLFVAVGGV